MIRCEACEAPIASELDNPEDDYGEHVCDDCVQNRNERAWERFCEDFHDGGCVRFNRS